MNSETGSADLFAEAGYEAFLAALRTQFERQATAKHLFTTDASGLFEAYLAAFPQEERQHHNCHACRRFLETFGGLVAIGEDGEASPAMWSASFAPTGFLGVARVLEEQVRRARVTGVFLESKETWGLPVTGEWHHLAVYAPAHLVFARNPLKTAGQAMAERREEHGMLCRALADYPMEVVERALPLLESDSLYRSEKCLGVARWFLELHKAREATKHRERRDNLVWRAVAEAPPGWCHIRSTMIGTLLEDLAANLPFGEVSRRFAEKMHPLQYQRPQAAPSAGQIARAEKVIEKLGAAGALARRFATLDDLKLIWRPKASAPEGGKKRGEVFAHLREDKRGVTRGLEVPAQHITWEKLARTVLPNAERIDYCVPARGPFIAFVTAATPDAPPILQWDREDKRNAVSWYVYHGGSPATQWKLTPGAWCQVTGVTLMPPQWDEERTCSHFERGAVFILEGAVDQNEGAGIGLFPEFLQSEFHEIRSTLEAFSRREKLSGREQANACGVDLRQWGQTFRVKVSGSPVALSYCIDRWD